MGPATLQSNFASFAYNGMRIGTALQVKDLYHLYCTDQQCLR